MGSKALRLFLMYRVELKARFICSSFFTLKKFLMYRVELKVIGLYIHPYLSASFLMYRVELKDTRNNELTASGTGS